MGRGERVGMRGGLGDGKWREAGGLYVRMGRMGVYVELSVHLYSSV